MAVYTFDLLVADRMSGGVGQLLFDLGVTAQTEWHRRPKQQGFGLRLVDAMAIQAAYVFSEMDIGFRKFTHVLGLMTRGAVFYQIEDRRLGWIGNVFRAGLF